MSASGTVAVSVVIAARNEAANVAACIASASWAREIVVVEDGSTDDTARIASDAGARVMRHPFSTIGGQRNAAIESAGEEWILVLDADERATPGLGSEVASVIASVPASGGPDAYRVSRRNFFLGREIRHGGWERDRPVRLFRRSARYDGSRVHEHVDVHGPIGDLSQPLTHEPYPTLDAWFEKFDRYSRWWAEDRFERGRRASAAMVVIRPPLRFLGMYVIRGGWMDGAAGAVLACMAAASVMAKYARLWALGLRNPPHRDRISRR